MERRADALLIPEEAQVHPVTIKLHSILLEEKHRKSGTKININVGRLTERTKITNSV